MVKYFSVSFMQNDGESAVKSTVKAKNEEEAVEELIKIFPGVADHIEDTENYTLVVKEAGL